MPPACALGLRRATARFTESLAQPDSVATALTVPACPIHSHRAAARAGRPDRGAATCAEGVPVGQTCDAGPGPNRNCPPISYFDLKKSGRSSYPLTHHTRYSGSR